MSAQAALSSGAGERAVTTSTLKHLEGLLAKVISQTPRSRDVLISAVRGQVLRALCADVPVLVEAADDGAASGPVPGLLPKASMSLDTTHAAAVPLCRCAAAAHLIVLCTEVMTVIRAALAIAVRQGGEVAAALSSSELNHLFVQGKGRINLWSIIPLHEMPDNHLQFVERVGVGSAAGPPSEQLKLTDTQE